MKLLVKSGKIEGRIIAPSSKSIMQRVLAAAMLSDKPIVINNPSLCDDSISAMGIIEKLGSCVKNDGEKIIVLPGAAKTANLINCGQSGLAIRMFSPVISLFDRTITLTGEGSLLRRPMNFIEKSLNELGVKCSTNKGFLPIIIRGPVLKNIVHVDGESTSQFLTGLLIALSKLKLNSSIYVKNLKSRSYIDITIDVLKGFNVEILNKDYTLFKIAGGQWKAPDNYTVQGDWSGASFMIVAAAIAGSVEIKGLNKKSNQGDRNILTVLEMVGASFEFKNEVLFVKEKLLDPFKFDATHCPDLFPPLLVLAMFCRGISIIKGVSRLKYKESDRAKVLKGEFEKLGRRIEVVDDEMLVYGDNSHLSSGVIDPHDDHRIAMAAATCALRSDTGILIKNIECVKKSYPEFFNDFKQIGAKLSLGVCDE